jgi:hypothetical protein
MPGPGSVGSSVGSPLSGSNSEGTPLLSYAAGLESGELAATPIPVDKSSFIYIIFFIQGLGMLYPWNVLINAAPFFTVRFKGTTYEYVFENAFTFTYT